MSPGENWVNVYGAEREGGGYYNLISHKLLTHPLALLEINNFTAINLQAHLQ